MRVVENDSIKTGNKKTKQKKEKNIQRERKRIIRAKIGPTAPGAPRRSPIQVLFGADVA